MTPGTRSPHGTRSRYNNQGCRCQACREAQRQGLRRFRDRAAAARELVNGRLVAPDISHGVSGYQNHLCRCDVCVAANAEACRAWRARRAVA